MRHAAQSSMPKAERDRAGHGACNNLPASSPAVAGRTIVAVAVSGRVVATVDRSRVIDAGRGDNGDDRCRVECRRHDVGAAVSPRWSVTVVTIASTTAGASVTGG